jgi:hypothetical protein
MGGYGSQVSLIGYPGSFPPFCYGKPTQGCTGRSRLGSEPVEKRKREVSQGFH